ncbi:DUF397 domain-containing protein [Nocardia grenadensis]
MSLSAEDRDGPALSFTPAAWASFTSRIRAGRFDRP